MIGELEARVPGGLTSGEVLSTERSVDNSAVKKPKLKIFPLFFGAIFLTSLTIVVFLSSEFEEIWAVSLFGKIGGFLVMVFLGIWWFNFTDFFQESRPSEEVVKYHHFLLTNKRIALFSKNKKWKRDLMLEDIKNISVTASRNKLTLHVDDPLEPSITLNGVRSPLEFAKRIDNILHGEFGLN